MVFASAEAIKGIFVPVCVCSFPVVFISLIYSPALQMHLFFKEVGKSYIKSRTNGVLYDSSLYVLSM